MKILFCSWLLLCSISFCYAGFFYSTKLISEQNEPCDGGDSNCYKKLYAPTVLDLLSTVSTSRYHINTIYEFRDICTTTPKMIQVASNWTGTNITCMNYFCQNFSSTLIHSVLTLQPVLNRYTKIPYFVRGPLQNGEPPKPWYQPHMDMTNYCYYCQHDERFDFLQKIQNYSCIYFWQHSKHYGDDGYNKKENPTLLSTMHTQYMEYRRDLLGTRDPTTNISDFLYLTKIRSTYHDEIGEEYRGEYPYFIFCSSYSMYAVYCDAYTWVGNPIRYDAYLLLDIIARIILIVITIVMVCIPRMAFFFKKQNFKYAIKDLVLDLKNQCTFFMILGIFFIILEDIREFGTTDFGYVKTGGVWRIISIASTIASFGALMILWSHIYHSTKELDDGEKLNAWNRFLIIFWYGSMLLGLLVPILMTIILINSSVKFETYSYTFILVIVYVTILIAGFSIYGMRMFYVLKRSSDSIRFHKLKFTKFMMIILVLLLHSLFWLCIQVVEYGNSSGKLGLFINLWRSQILDCSLMIMYPFMIYMLYESKKFWDFTPYSKIRHILISKIRIHKKPPTSDDLETSYIALPA
jgi:hypothetical protein